MNETPEFATLRDKIRWEKEQRAKRYARFAEIFAAAQEAGRAAHDAAAPAPMVVERHTNPFDDSSPVEKRWAVSEGVCGFAWVRITPGNSSFARWLVKEGHASKAYGGGIQVRVRTAGQSYERKMAYADAMADVLKSAPELKDLRIFAQGRLD